MATPSNPGWIYGFVPTASQWAQAFSAKVDYPGPIGQGGTGAVTAQGAEYNIDQRVIVDSTAVSMSAVTQYYVRTSVGAFTLYLPPLSTMVPPDWVDVADIDFNANVNNITITAYNTDQIVLYGSSASSQTLNVAGARTRLVVNNNTWRMLV